MPQKWLLTLLTYPFTWAPKFHIQIEKWDLIQSVSSSLELFCSEKKIQIRTHLIIKVVNVLWISIMSQFPPFRNLSNTEILNFLFNYAFLLTKRLVTYIILRVAQINKFHSYDSWLIAFIFFWHLFSPSFL